MFYEYLLTVSLQVDAGKNAPVTREGAGRVENESLSAESYRADGEFAQNRNAEPENASNTAMPRSFAGEAPSYVNSQYTSDKNGPHGKNLKEGGFEHQEVYDGVRKAFNSEPGSINDPGRLAEAKFEQREAANPGVASNRDAQMNTGTAFDGLGRDENA